MAQSSKSASMADGYARPQLRTLGTKSARRDLARDQPKTASDLDGIGTPEPIYQVGADQPDEEPSRIYEGVDPAVKEQEKLRAERREAAIAKSKAKGQYSTQDAAADKARAARDDTRRQIGAKADNFSEALRRDADKAKKRIEARRATDERNKPEPVTGSNSMPEPPTDTGSKKAPSGGLVDQGMFDPATGKDTRSDEMKARMEYNQLRDLYIKRGAARNVDAQGNPMSFRQFVAAEMQAQPDTPLAQSLQKGDTFGFFSATKDRADDAYTQEMAGRRDKFNASQEDRRRAINAARTGGASVIADYNTKYENALRNLQKKQQAGAVTPSDLLDMAREANILAGGYSVAHSMYPGRGFDVMGAQKLLEANQYASYATRMTETASTNDAMRDVSESANRQPQEPTTEDRLKEMGNGPAGELLKREAAAQMTGDAGADVYNSNYKAINAAAFGKAAESVMDGITKTGRPLAPGTPEFITIQNYAANVDKPTFVRLLAGRLTNLPPAVAATYAGQLYESAKPQKISTLYGLGRTVWGSGGMLYQPNNPPPPGFIH